VVAAGPAGQVLAVLPGRDGAVQEFAALAGSGLAGEDIGWYLGVAPAGAPRYVVVVVLENSQEVGQAQRTGRALLDYILSAR
jgi:cell division protein FtsI/penicillin-binding protein 2